MAKKPIDISRRQLLRGAGGFALSLPFMQSLLPREAWGQSTFVRKPRLAWMCTNHGGAWEANMFPNQSLLSRQMSIFSGHTVRAGTLSATTNNGNAMISPILSAPSSQLTPTLISKMNVLQGLDISFDIEHNTGGHLGNFARNDGNSGEGTSAQATPRPTIDQILATSSTFYPGGIRVPAMVIGGGPQISWSWSDALHRSGSITNVEGVDSSLALFNSIFVQDPGMNPPPMAQRPLVVDRVIDSYRSLRNGNTRLSAGDRQRLDDYMSHLSTLQMRLAPPTTAPAPTCSGVTRPTDDANNHQRATAADAARAAQLYNDVILAAFMCGTSRIAVHAVGDTSQFVGYTGDWHQSIAHQWQNAGPQATLTQSYQAFFQTAFLDLATKLDVEEAPGQTYLDNTLMAWTQECGMETHTSVSTPVVTFGSAAGYFNTGLFCDYSKNGAADARHDPGAGNVQYLGLLYNQWLATVMMAMGLPASEFELWGYHGVGNPQVGAFGWGAPFNNHYVSTSSQYYQSASNPLPFLNG